MPKLSGSLPAYRLHRPSGQAVVTLRGKDHYLGPHGTRVSKAEYDRVTGQWLAAGRCLPAATAPLSVLELVHAHWKFAKQHYCKVGEPTHEVAKIHSALKPVMKLYRKTAASQFGPLELKAVRAAMIDLGWSRNYVNQSAGRVRRVFKWGVSEELVPPSVLHGLQSVDRNFEGRDWRSMLLADRRKKADGENREKIRLALNKEQETFGLLLPNSSSRNNLGQLYDDIRAAEESLLGLKPKVEAAEQGVCEPQGRERCQRGGEQSCQGCGQAATRSRDTTGHARSSDSRRSCQLAPRRL
jgi:hypothetical protein